jgi:uncharacterized membrane protein YobD (UPF0266 family)
MNEQPQQNNLQPDQGGEKPLYNDQTTPHSSFSGYDLTQGQEPQVNAPQTAPEPPRMPEDDAVLEWEASEYVHHDKSPMWFAGLAGIMLVLLAVAYFLTHSWTFIVLVVVMAVAIGVFATRAPRILHYALTNTGMHIEESFYHYSDFRAFGIVEDGGLYSIMLIPIKRFMPAVSIYFAEDDGEEIVDILGARLPMQELHLDSVDRLMRRLRF